MACANLNICFAFGAAQKVVDGHEAKMMQNLPVSHARSTLSLVVRPKMMHFTMIGGIRSVAYLISKIMCTGNFFLNVFLHFRGAKMTLFGHLGGLL